MPRHLRDESGYGKNTKKAGWSKQTTPMDSKSGAKPKSRLLGFLFGGKGKKS